MSKSISSSTVFLSLAAVVLAGLAVAVWSRDYGKVVLEIDDANSSIPAVTGTVQQIPVNITNTTALRVRLVGTNAC